MYIGLKSVGSRLEELWQTPISIGAPKTVVGAVDYAGTAKPLPSSAVQITIEGRSVWVPSPVDSTSTSGGATFFLHGGELVVLPIIRLCCVTRQEIRDIEYLTILDWLRDAICRWRFPIIQDIGAASSDSTHELMSCTVIDHLRRHGVDPVNGLQIIAAIIRYALFGADSSQRLFIAPKYGIILPTRPQWIRPVVDTPLGKASAGNVVLSAAIDESEDNQATGRAAIPKANLRAMRYRMYCTETKLRSLDRGIDPVHTPEGNSIRLIGRVGEGVTVSGRRLVITSGNDVTLSCSTAQIPFAGHNDPRRLLMAANMQMQAVRLEKAESPIVHTSSDREDVRPFGTNVRVGYLAWEGLNHEDAWVISETAALRLVTNESWTQTIPVRSIERPVRVLVTDGQAVARGQPLVERWIAPAMLSSSIEVLAGISNLTEETLFDAEEGDLAEFEGVVTHIESWDLIKGTGFPSEWEIPRAQRSRFRQVVRITLQRRLQLQVGDKLANRHGHKGIVGAILPDEDMPQWDGLPLDALIDPVSVLNRSNWGQVFETILGGHLSEMDADGLFGFQATQEQREYAERCCRTKIDPPRSYRWLDHSIEAVAGVQFVMRLPHHACDKVSTSPSHEGVRRRSQRFGEMDHWALLAHDVHPAIGGRGLRQFTTTAQRFIRLLAAAGYDCRQDADSITVCNGAISEPPAEGEISIRPHLLGLAEAYDQVDSVDTKSRACLVFDPPVTDVTLPRDRQSRIRAREKENEEATVSVCWLPIVPLCDRRARRLPDGSEINHSLTSLLRNIVRAARYRKVGRTTKGVSWTAERLTGSLRRAIEKYMQAAYTLAVGECAIGEGSSKQSLLRRGLMGQRVSNSARATAAPAGSMPLGLNEVGLPHAIARALIGQRGLQLTDEQLAQELKRQSFWIKRDPVLHRWGLLRVKPRLVTGSTIRLSASLLGPMGADFDGDTVALFADLPNQPNTSEAGDPCFLAWDSNLEREMFVPGKQFIYGLGIVSSDAQRLSEFQECLAKAGAPPWDASVPPKDALRRWVKDANAGEPVSRWWGIVEEHAITALSTDPGMGLGIMPPERIRALAVVRWEAAKKDVWDKEDNVAWNAILRILEGRSLEIYSGEHVDLSDPIADVLIVGRESVARFGGVLRRLLFSTVTLRPSIIRDAQTLTEQATQRALSVKAGRKPLPFGDYERQIRRIIAGELPAPQAQDVADLFKYLEKVCIRLIRDMGQPATWLQWLKQPHKLANCLAEDREQVLRLPLSDCRLALWLEPVKREGI